MRSTMHLLIAVLILITSYVSYMNADYNEYVNLISDVRNEYSASSVFFVFSKKNPHMQTYTIAHGLSRTFSDQGVFTMITHVDDLNERLNYHRKQTGRPLVVLFVKSFEDHFEFIKSNQTMDKSYAIWLAIFHGKSDGRLCDYCRHPVENKFRLRLDTLMMVLCCGGPVLHEWWSIDGNRTETGKFGTWGPNERLKLLSTVGLYARRSDVRGTGLRIIIMDPSTRFGGTSNRGLRFFNEYLRELQRAMNFTITALLQTDEFGNYNVTTKRWSGAVGLLMQGKADLAVIGLVMTEARLAVVDYTYPLFSTPMKLIIRQPDRIRGRWFAHFKVFELNIWMMISALIIMTPLLLTVIEVRHGSKSFGSLYLEKCLSVWGIFCLQGLSRYPAGTPMRIAFITMNIPALVVYVAYSAKLISYLTVFSYNLPFSDLAGFLEDGSYKLIVLRNGPDYAFLNSSTAVLSKKMMTLMKPWNHLPPNPNNAWKQVCEERVAFYTNKLPGSTSSTTCKVIQIGTGEVKNVGMALPAGSQYTGVVNYYIQQFRGNGIYHRMKKIFSDSQESIEDGHNVDFSEVTPILSILAGGIILALVVLYCESTYYRIRNRRRLNLHRIKLQKKRIHRSNKCVTREELSTKAPRPRRILDENRSIIDSDIVRNTVHCNHESTDRSIERR